MPQHRRGSTLGSGRRLIFVGGAPRSGTSLVQKILGLHSEVFAGPEFDHMPAIMGLYRRLKRGIDCGRQATFYDHEALGGAVVQLINQLLVSAAETAGKWLVSEKTPDNVQVFDELGELFPEARFIFVVRDPRAVVHSMLEVGKRAQPSKKHVSVGSNLLRDCLWIDRATSAGDAFAERNPERCYTIHYESLVKSPVMEARSLCAFLAIPFQDRMLETQKKNVSSEIVAQDGIWYTPAMYDRQIDGNSSHAWRTNLRRGDLAFVEDFFAKRQHSCHLRYDLKPAGASGRFRHPWLFTRYWLVPRGRNRIRRIRRRFVSLFQRR